MEKLDKNNFVFYIEWCDILDDLPDDQAIVLLRAINRFVKTREDTKIDNPTLQAIFNMIKRKIIEDSDKYAEVCRKRSEARNRNRNQEQEQNPQESTSVTSDNNCQQLSQESTSVSDSDSDSDSVSDCECVSECDYDLLIKKEKNKKEKSKRFIPPTLEEVKAYCEERKNDIDPQQFLDHYEANGWMRGKNKIRDWKACVRTWEGNCYNKAPPKKSNSEKIDEYLLSIINGEGNDKTGTQ